MLLNITDATTQVANHIAVQTALIKEQKALEEKQKAEKEAKGKEESLKNCRNENRPRPYAFVCSSS